MPLLPEAKNCDISVKKNFRKISSALGYTATPTWEGIILAGLTASRLLSTDANKEFESVADLTAWIIETANQVLVVDNGDGTVTLSLPQDYHTGASPTLANITITVNATIGNVAKCKRIIAGGT